MTRQNLIALQRSGDCPIGMMTAASRGRGMIVAKQRICAGPH
jgi:hypothetical protein